MKKANKKSNVIQLKNKERKKVSNRHRKTKRRLELERLVRDYFHAPDPNPPLGWIKSSTVYEDFLIFGLTDCSKTLFGKLVGPYVERKKLRSGTVHYRLRESSLMAIRGNIDLSDGLELSELAHAA